MDSLTLETGMLTFPAEDITLVKSLSKKFGWNFSRKRKSGLDKAIEDVKAGRVEETDNFHDFLKSMGADV